MTGDVKRIVVRDDQPGRDITFRAVVITVALMLFISWALLYVAIGPHTTPPGDGDGNGEAEPLWWMVPAETHNITEDTVWSGEDRTLDRPVVVRTGASLSIVDMHIRIPLEDMVFWRQPVFTVEEGASLELDNTRLRVFQDPRLASAVIGVVEAEHQLYPHIARPVNLVEARTPVLKFVLYHPGYTTDVSVAVLPEDGDELVLLDSFKVGDLQPRTQHDILVPLHQYNGTVPWVVIFLGSFPTDLTFISELRVIDGDGPPPGDMFPTGNAYEDGWRVHGFFPIHTYQGNVMREVDQVRGEGELWRGLIEAKGDVTVRDSQLDEPDGMGREVYLDYIKEAMDPEEFLPAHLSGSHGGHIGIDGGTLTVEGSTLENVPLTAVNATLDLSATNFTGDSDLVSLTSPSGTIERCGFQCNPSEWIPFSRPRERYLWALAVEGSDPKGRLVLEHCTFQDAEQAMDLSHANVEVDDLWFNGVSQLAVWDHNSRGLEDWEAFLSNNQFHRVYENLLFRTNTTEVEFYNSDLPGEVVEVHRGNPLRFDLDIWSPVQGSLSFAYGDRARYMVPELLLKSGGLVDTSDEATAQIRWKGEDYRFPVAPGVKDMRVDLAEMVPVGPITDPAPSLGVYRVAKDEGMGPDTFAFTIQVYPRELLEASNATLGWYLDDEPLDEMDMEETISPTGSVSLLFRKEVGLTPGIHSLELFLISDGEGGALIDPLHLDLMVANGSEGWTTEDVMGADYILLYPEYDISFPPLTYGADDGLGNVEVVGQAGSTARFDLSGVSEDAGFTVQVHGNASVEVANGTCQHVGVMTDMLTTDPGDGGKFLSLRNITTTTVHAVAGGHDLLMRDVISLNVAYLHAYGGQRILIEGCTFKDHVGWLDCGWTSVVLRNSTFMSDWPRGFVVTSYYMVNLTVEDCIFSGAFLAIFHPGQSSFWETRYLNVTGCLFGGDDAILYIGSNIVDISFYDDDPDWVPPLEGTIEGNDFMGGGNDAVLHFGLYGPLWGVNALHEDARLFAMYITRLQVIPPDTTPSHGNYVFVDRPGIETDWPYAIYRWISMDGEVLYDVTDAPSREADPPLLPVLLRSTDYNNRIIRGFATLDPDADNDEATYPVLPDFYWLLEPIVGPWEP